MATKAAQAKYSSTAEVVLLVNVPADYDRLPLTSIEQLNVSETSKDPCGLQSRFRSTSLVLWCVLALISVLALAATLILVLRPTVISEDSVAQEWFITREMWQAIHFVTLSTTIAFEPLKLVVIHHTASQNCFEFDDCALRIRAMQYRNIRNRQSDIAYNFLVGNDGRVYEGRGWQKEGLYAPFLDRCSLGIGFVGDYREEISGHSIVSSLQVARTMMLLEYGVQRGFLHPQFEVVAARDVQNTLSPGSNLYYEISSWNNFVNGSYFRNFPEDSRCEMIYGLS